MRKFNDIVLLNTNAVHGKQFQKMENIKRQLRYMVRYIWRSLKKRHRWMREYRKRHRKRVYKRSRRPTRFIIYPHDIAEIFGVHIRTAQRMMRDARFLLGKRKRSCVTVKEFCRLNELDEESMLWAIHWVNSWNNKEGPQHLLNQKMPGKMQQFTNETEMKKLLEEIRKKYKE
jgi:hypothetical protein